jgi:predicted lipoprotein with Yx(FWY)xxD motif
MAVVNGSRCRREAMGGLRWLVPLGLVTAGYAATATVPAAASPSAPVVKEVKSSKLGEILVNAQGRTLYRYTPDSATKVTCTGGCVVSWPPLTLPNGTTQAVGGPGVTGLTTIKSGGKLQVEYRGHPLYTFVGDTRAGTTSGQGLDGKWFVVGTAGAKTTASAGTTKAKAPSSGSSGSGGYGY